MRTRRWLPWYAGMVEFGRSFIIVPILLPWFLAGESRSWHDLRARQYMLILVYAISIGDLLGLMGCFESPWLLLGLAPHGLIVVMLISILLFFKLEGFLDGLW